MEKFLKLNETVRSRFWSKVMGPGNYGVSPLHQSTIGLLHIRTMGQCAYGTYLPTHKSLPKTWALLQIAVRMAFLMRSTVWMTDADAERFAAMLATAAGDDDADSRAQAPMCFVDRPCCRALTARFSSRPGGDVFRAAARAPRRRGGGDGAVRARPLPLASAGRSLARLWRVQPDSPDPT